MSVPTAVPTYEALLAKVRPRVIHTSKEHERQLIAVDHLMTAYARAPCTAYEDIIDLLVTLISWYEDQTVSFAEVNAEELQKHIRGQR